MYYNYKVARPPKGKGVTLNTIKSTTYVCYTYGREYKPEKKYNIPKRTTIGKVCEDDPGSMYPNQNYIKLYPGAVLPEAEAETTRSGCLHVGASMVIRKIINEYNLEAAMRKIIGKDSGLFLDLAAYSILAENNAGQYYPEYAYNHPLFTDNMRIYSDSKVSSFINSLTADQSIDFLKEWNKDRAKREKIYISYDSTNKNCQAGDVEIAELGNAKDDKSKPVINYAVAYDRDNREPLFYEDYPGSINDVSQLRQVVDKAKGYGYKNIGFILDRGYFSEQNIRHMERNGYDFIMMVKGMKDLVKLIVSSQIGSFEKKRSNSIRKYKLSGTTVMTKLFPKDEKNHYFHIYYSPYKAAAEREALENRIDQQKKVLEKYRNKEVKAAFLAGFEKYFELEYYHKGKEDEKFLYAREKTDVIDEEINLCGYFVLVTSAKMYADEAIELYKSRDGSEKLFRGDKSYLGNKSFRTQTGESTEAKIFIEFVALIIRNRIYTLIKDKADENETKDNYMTVPAALKELEKIEMIRLSDNIYRLDHAVTKTQKNILKAFGIDEGYVRSYAEELGRKLSEASGSQISKETA